MHDGIDDDLVDTGDDLVLGGDINDTSDQIPLLFLGVCALICGMLMVGFGWWLKLRRQKYYLLHRHP